MKKPLITFSHNDYYTLQGRILSSTTRFNPYTQKRYTLYTVAGSDGTIYRNISNIAA